MTRIIAGKPAPCGRAEGIEPALADEPLVRIRVLALAASWRCSAACAHCYLPVELRRGGAAPEPAVEAALDDLPASIEVVCITGGEPFEDAPRLLGNLERIARAGRKSTVVTGGHWARNRPLARSLLADCAARGLLGLSVSVDAYHRPSLPLDALEALVRHARELGMVVNVRSVGDRADPRVAALRAAGLLDGDAAESRLDLEGAGEARALPPDLVRRPPADLRLCALAPLVQPDGRVASCCSPHLFELGRWPFVLGDLRRARLPELLDRASRSWLLVGLALAGPEALRALAGLPPVPQAPTACAGCASLAADVAALDAIEAALARDRAACERLWMQCRLAESQGTFELLPAFEPGGRG